jgi:hypothetical protein
MYLQTTNGGVVVIPVRSFSTDDDDGGASLAKSAKEEFEASFAQCATAQLVSVQGPEALPMGMTMFEALNGCGIVGFRFGVVTMPVRAGAIFVPKMIQ